MSLQSYKEYEKKRMEKNTLYVRSLVAESIDELSFFKSAHLDRIPWCSIPQKDRIVYGRPLRGELFMKCHGYTWPSGRAMARRVEGPSSITGSS